MLATLPRQLHNSESGARSAIIVFWTIKYGQYGFIKMQKLILVAFIISNNKFSVQ